jgi:hypothetical protein
MQVLLSDNPRNGSATPEKKMTRFKLLVAGAILSMLMATSVFAHGNNVRPQAYRTEGREVAAPSWSAACMTDHGPSECSEPMWIYSGHDTITGYRNAF